METLNRLKSRFCLNPKKSWSAPQLSSKSFWGHENRNPQRADERKLEDLTYDIKLLRVDFIEPKSMDFLPGQYAQIKIPGVEVIRAYSISSDPNDKSFIEFIIRYVPKGLATTYVHKALRIGDEVIITGPYGDFFLNEERSENWSSVTLHTFW